MRQIAQYARFGGSLLATSLLSSPALCRSTSDAASAAREIKGGEFAASDTPPTETATAELAPLQTAVIQTALISPAADARSQPLEPETPERYREGFTLGLLTGFGVGGAVGYPNSIEKIDNASYEQRFSTSPMSSLSLFVGSALTDWLTAGLVYTAGGAADDERTLGTGLIGLHFEGYPAYSLGSALKDVGLLAEFGAGFGVVLNSDDTDEILADGGSMRALALGAFWEPLVFWHCAAGPVLMYRHQSSESMSFNSVTAGFRIALYGTRSDDD